MLQNYLPLVVKHSVDEAKVIVADNASTDDSVAYLRANFPHVDLITLDKNYGFAEGYNQALGRVEAEYYVLLNSDVEVTEHWLSPLIAYMDEHGEVAACQPKLRSVRHRESFEYAGACGGFIDNYGYPFCRGRLFDTVEHDDGQYDRVAEVMWATGACLFIRSKDYWEAGGLDGRFFAHNEEIDLCWRLHLQGRSVVCLPQSVVYHVGGGTLPKGNPMKTFLNFRNNLTMLYKNLPDEDLAHVMRVRWFLDYLAAWQTLLLNGNWGDFRAIYRARRAFKKWLPDFRADRERIQRMRVVSRVPQRLSFSLLWQYYVRRCRAFSQLPQL
jgi:GT2 family glycosyltransferase